MVNSYKRASVPFSIKSFLENKGLKEYKGIRGFDNLMILIRADINSLFNDYSLRKTNRKGTQRVNSVHEILEPYKDGWDAWTASNFCSLTEMEVRAINYYKIHFSHRQMAAQLNIPYSLVYSYFRNALRTLKSAGTLTKFKEWIASEEQTPEQELLDAPIVGLRSLMSTRLCFALARIETTIREILEKHTVEDLLQYRGIGANSIEELKKILEQHHCLSLLKENKK